MAGADENVRQFQEFVQKAKLQGKYSHFVPKSASLTSIAIPVALTALCFASLAKGTFHMATGTGKLEDM